MKQMFFVSVIVFLFIFGGILSWVIFRHSAKRTILLTTRIEVKSTLDNLQREPSFSLPE